jgi:hypothetical protein
MEHTVKAWARIPGRMDARGRAEGGISPELEEAYNPRVSGRRKK